MSQARAAVAQLNALTKAFAAASAEREQQAAELEATRLRSDAARRFGDEIEALRQQFISMQGDTDVHARGLAFETLLANFFRLFDMEPKLSYSLKLEQIDGSLNFDTDDYIVEARWRKEQVDRGEADIFAAKVHRKGKNALGLIISIEALAARPSSSIASPRHSSRWTAPICTPPSINGCAWMTCCVRSVGT